MLLNGLLWSFTRPACAQYPPVTTVWTDNSTIFIIPNAVSLTEQTHSHAKHKHAPTLTQTHASPLLVSLGLGVKHFHLGHWLGN